MLTKRIKIINIPPHGPRHLNEHEQIILQEHGVLYYDDEDLVITANRTWMKAIQYSHPSYKQSLITEQVPTAVN